MPYRALTDVLLGQSPTVPEGELLPDTFLNMDGTPLPVDFERLVEIGSAEKISQAAKPSRAKSAKPAAKKDESS